MAKHILSCSFGKDSIATALLALQHGEPLDELVAQYEQACHFAVMTAKRPLVRGPP